MPEKTGNFILGLFPGFVLFIVIPFAIYIPHQEFFCYNLIGVIPFVIAFVFWGGFIAFVACLKRFRNSKLFYYLFFSGLFFILKDIICPVESGGFFGLDILIPILEPNINIVIESILFLTMVFSAIYIPVGFVKRVFIPIIIILIIIQTGYITINTKWFGYKVEPKMNGPTPILTSGNLLNKDKNNVYMICLDSFVGRLFLPVIKNENIESEFNGFTVFPNNIANYIYTYPSIASVMSSTVYSGGSMKEFINLISEGELFSNFANDGFTIWQYVNGQQWISNKATHVRAADTHHPKSLKLYNSTIAFWLLRIIQTSLKQDLWRWIIGKKFHIEHQLHPTAALGQLLKLAIDEKMRPSTGQFVYAHANIPHGPFIFDRDCRNIYPPYGDFIGQATCSLKSIISLIKQLKEDDKFDAATIIIFSDHGTADPGTEGFKSFLTQETKKKIERVLLLGDAYKMEIESNALLLIKPPHSPNQKLKVSYRQTQNLDIAATIQDLSNVPMNPKNGVSVFSEDFPENREIDVFVGYVQFSKRGRLLQIGQTLFEGELNHFTFSSHNGWRVLPNIPFEW